MTYQDIEASEQEIKRLRHIRQIFIGVGWGLIGLFIVLAILAIVFIFINDDVSDIFFISAPISFTTGLVLLILSAAIFGKKINIIYKSVRLAKQYLEMKRMKEINNK